MTTDLFITLLNCDAGLRAVLWN